MAAGNTYTQIASTTLGSTATTVTFSSIPATYTDLILVFNPVVTTLSGIDYQITFNSDTASNYSRTYLLGDGTSASSGRSTSQTSYSPGGIYNNSTVTVQILNYSNTTTNKTPIARVNIAAQYTAATVGLWRNTAAINRIDITTSTTANFNTGSTFNLYGITAA